MKVLIVFVALFAMAAAVNIADLPSDLSEGTIAPPPEYLDDPTDATQPPPPDYPEDATDPTVEPPEPEPTSTPFATQPPPPEDTTTPEPTSSEATSTPEPTSTLEPTPPSETSSTTSDPNCPTAPEAFLHVKLGLDVEAIVTINTRAFEHHFPGFNHSQWAVFKNNVTESKQAKWDELEVKWDIIHEQMQNNSHYVQEFQEDLVNNFTAFIVNTTLIIEEKKAEVIDEIIANKNLAEEDVEAAIEQINQAVHEFLTKVKQDAQAGILTFEQRVEELIDGILDVLLALYGVVGQVRSVAANTAETLKNALEGLLLILENFVEFLAEIREFFEALIERLDDDSNTDHYDFSELENAIAGMIQTTLQSAMESGWGPLQQQIKSTVLKGMAPSPGGLSELGGGL